jgi:hypothetical protein
VTGAPHIYNHDVAEEEVMEVLEKPGEDRAGREGSKFVLTSYELTGKPLAAYRSRRKKKRQ